MGPLTGLKVIEIASIGPGPYCGMLLADLGAEVIRVGRIETPFDSASGGLLRGRQTLEVDLKQPQGVEIVRRLIRSADAAFEGFRPGVAERLGIGPEVCLADKPSLVYGRMTGWGQEGPLANSVGHDINYVALSGALHGIGRPGGKPVVAQNYLGDFGGGGMLLAFGMLAALLHARQTGEGQVVDAAMVDGAAQLTTGYHAMLASGLYDDGTGTSFLGGAAHFYDTYETRDGKYVSVGAIEPHFYAEFIERLGLDPQVFAPHGFRFEVDDDVQAAWTELKPLVAAAFARKTRDEWCELLEGSDVCFAPVLSLSEVADHPHHRARNAFVKVGDHLQPAPAPRFSGTRPDDPRESVLADPASLLAAAGLDEAEIQGALESGAVGDKRRS
ncbi:MAG: CaiB/BaiF CoA-transferase family protein [Pseudomonadota bacterium]